MTLGATPQCGTVYPPFTGMRNVRSTALALAVAALAGCADMQKIAPTHTLMAEPTAALSAAEWPQRNAWDDWSDAVLAQLIEQALRQQPNLQAVRARLAQAQAAVDTADAARGPQISGAVDLTRQRFSENGLVPPPLAGSIGWVSQVRIDASWEWDLFGRQQAALDAAVGQSKSAQAEAQAASVLLAANVASAYVSLARAVEQRALAEAAQSQRTQLQTLVRQRIAAGLDTNVELRQAESFTAQTRVDVHAADEQIERLRHALAELTGQPPNALGTLSPLLAQVPVSPLPSGLPADLVGRRADLVAQRWRVEAASREVDVARAQFYPNINLIGFVGLSSIGLNQLVQAGSEIYGGGPAIRLPIFEGGKLRANLRSRAAEVDAAVEGYNATLLRALREVADELSSLRAIEQQQRAQAQALASAEAAFDLALQRYRAGLGNYLVVLSAETNVLAQRRVAADLKARHLGTEVALSRALGGGYRGELPGAAGSTTVTQLDSARP
jgi:NodT family efflux transporter outer membrane factor (OMF) lipoprotein